MSDIQKNGLNYSSMMMGLLEKTEENTQYIIGISNSQASISEQIPSLNDQISGLVLRTDQNITTVQELQLSVDKQFGKISDKLSDISSQFAVQGLRIETLENLATTLQAQIDELKASIATPVDVAQIDLNTQDISFLKTLLGADRVKNPGDVDILGKLSAEITETGGIMIKVVDKDAATIGDMAICPKDQEEKDGDCISGTGDGKSAMVKTKAVTTDSKIYVTPVGSTDNQVLYVGEVKDGESFEVKVDNLILAPIHFNWWIVETATP
jgi:hypothetical protein